MKTKKAIIYARVSSVGDRQSTERQISDLTRYAGYANLTVVKVFEERISGAARNTERPVLLEAVGYARANDITQILISELSRLGRNAFEVLSMVKCRFHFEVQNLRGNLLNKTLLSPSGGGCPSGGGGLNRPQERTQT